MPCTVQRLEEEVRRLEQQLRAKQIELEKARQQERKEEETAARRREVERLHKALFGDETKIRREVSAAERSGRWTVVEERLWARAAHTASILEGEHLCVIRRASVLRNLTAVDSAEDSLRVALVTAEAAAWKEVQRQCEESARTAHRAVREMEEAKCSEVVPVAVAAETTAKADLQRAQERSARVATAKATAEAISTEELAGLMLQARDVRNVVVIAHVDAGKTTLTDALLARGGVIAESRAGNACHMDSGVEQERGITIKAASVSLAFRTPAAPSGNCVMNLIDSPGHADFNAEVTTAMRVSDGALVVVDAVEGVQVQTELVLQQALQERVVPCLVVNKADRLLCRLRQSPEDTYQRLMCAVEGVGRIVREGTSDSTSAVCRAALRRSIDPRPDEGSVAFTCGKDGWGFTLMTFARLMEARTGVPAAKTAKLFWGDNFWNAKTRKWSKDSTDAEGRALPRGFCHFILRPLLAILTGCQEAAWGVVEQEVERLWPGRWAAGLLSSEEQKKNGEAAFALLMRRLLPAADALVELAAGKLPAPCIAQDYRAEILCEEAGEEETLQGAVRECNPDGPLVFYVTKLVPVQRTWGFYAFGRVLSGRLRPGATVHVLGHGVQHVRKVALLMARKEMGVAEVPAGSLAAAVGLDGAQLKTATVVEPGLSRARPLRGIRHAVSPVVRSAVQLVAPSEQPQLVKALHWLQRSDPLVQCETASGQCVIAAGGELHLELCIQSLRERMEGPPGAAAGSTKGIKVARPAVARQETVRAQGPSCLAKSPAKLNRLWISAGPMEPGLPDALERGEIPRGHSEADAVQRVRALVDTWGWSRDEARSVWGVVGSSLLLDCTKGIPYLEDARPHIASAFEQIVSAGPICGEPLRGVVFRLTDAKLHGDKHHRGPAELLPAASRAMKAAMLREEAQPGLFEPVFRCLISSVAEAAGVVRGELPRRRGSVEDEQHADGGRVVLDGLLPVATSFGLADALRAQTGGRAFASCSFDHWRMMTGNPRPPAPAGRGSKTSEPQPASADLCLSAVRECRLRHALKGDAPTAADYEDRL